MVEVKVMTTFDAAGGGNIPVSVELMLCVLPTYDPHRHGCEEGDPVE